MYCDRVTAQGIGWDADHEVGFFIPLNESGGPAGERLVFWSPYIFIDSALGMVTGREIWGFRKTMGETGMPVNPGDPAHYWTKTTLFQQFGLNSHGELATVLELDGASATGPQHSSLADVMLGIQDIDVWRVARWAGTFAEFSRRWRRYAPGEPQAVTCSRKQ